MNAVPPVALPPLSSPWFNKALDRIDERLESLEDAADRINVRLDDADSHRDEILTMLRHNERRTILSLNRQGHGGIVEGLLEMPFDNNDLPTQAPHHLPLLHNVQSITNLTDVQFAQYCSGYFPGNPVPPTQAERARLIKKAIGCWASPR